MAAPTGFPTLSQIYDWETSHLEAAADATKPQHAIRHEREALMLRHSRCVWAAADTLAATDRAVARKILEAVDGLDALKFPAGTDEQLTHVLMADYVTAVGPLPAAPHLIYCYPSARPDFWWCEGYDVGGGPYGFDSPIDVSGVG
jgi:hypothetical protein